MTEALKTCNECTKPLVIFDYGNAAYCQEHGLKVESDLTRSQGAKLGTKYVLPKPATEETISK